MGRLETLYARLPVWAQHGAVSAYGVYWKWLRFGPGYRRYVREYAERDRFTPAQWHEWQSRRLREILTAAAAHVPYYRDAWTADARRAAQAGQLAELPLLEKDALRADAHAFCRRDRRPGHVSVHRTSGTTGTPIDVVWRPAEVRRALAVREARSAGWAGVSFRLPRATFSGRVVVPDAQSGGPFHRFNAVERQVYFSAYHLRAATAPVYIAALRRHRVRWMTGYTVSCYHLARFLLEHGLPPLALQAVITTSEKLMPEMRTVMERAYGGRVYEEYSTVECALFASECEQGRLHVSPDVGVVEILRPDGTPCDPGEPGDVVATCLLRDHQPLIRYRLGDVARWAAEPCPCGRAMPVLQEVVGRVEDVVVGPDGRRMVRFHGIFIDQPHIREGQIIQETRDRIRVRVVGTADFGPADEREVVRRVRQRLGEVGVVVEPVADIPRSASGKFRPVISLLHRQGIAEAERTGLSPLSRALLDDEADAVDGTPAAAKEKR